MQSPTEVIAEIERRYPRDILDFQILYAQTMSEHYPQNRRYARDLTVLTEAARMRELLVRADANEALGEQSPWHGDAEADACDRRGTYDRYVELKLMILQPVNTRRRSATRQTREQEPEARARASVQRRTPARSATHYRNDLTRSGEGGEGREERKQPMHAHWPAAERMRDIMRRLAEWFAQQKLRTSTSSVEPRERRGSPPVAATTSTEPAREQDTPQEIRPDSLPTARGETAPALSAPAAETPSGDEQHVAAVAPRPPACQPGRLFFADCGSTRRSAAVSAARRTGGPRSYTAGPGGACLRAAA
jgi:hypothetical protein